MIWTESGNRLLPLSAAIRPRPPPFPALQTELALACASEEHCLEQHMTRWNLTIAPPCYADFHERQARSLHGREASVRQ